jgi:hypothetical protein
LKKNLAFAAIALVLLLGATQSSNSVPGQLNAIQSQLTALQAQNASLAAQLASNGPRKFYLTKTLHTGDQALSACDMGYHMASLWEIHEPSNLRYDTGRGLTKPDSGSGPPQGGAQAAGWIRTGNFLGTFGIHGDGNCNAWTIPIEGASGSIVSLPGDWTLTGPSLSAVGPWIAGAGRCSDGFSVWCVQD